MARGRRVRNLVWIGMALALLVAGPATAAELTKITIAHPGPSFSFAATFIGLDRGFFKDEGLDLTYREIKGLGSSTAARGRKVELAMASGVSLIKGHVAKAPLDGLVMLLHRVNLELAVDKAKAAKAGITSASSIKDRAQFMKGKVIGIDRLRGIPDAWLQYVGSLAGLQAGKDYTIRAVGTGPSLFAALKRGDIDGFSLSLPWTVASELEGFGTLLISGPRGDIPALEPFGYIYVAAHPDYCKEQAATCKKVARGYQKSLDILRTNDANSLAILKKEFPKLRSEWVEASYRMYKSGVAPSGKPTLQALKTVQTMMLAAGDLEKPGLTDAELQSRLIQGLFD
ncbi:MAG: ABC transporter substrate-binding protein [Candidatus Tectomicrobia bacterium]|nr:ABC transporter substrate-binding protein [Candidatus Tectomicrobia bacterium]